jgi:AraC-like DNA-binding protein
MESDQEHCRAKAWSAHPTARASILIPIVRELERQRRPAKALLARHLIPMEQIVDPYLEIPLSRYVAFLETASEAGEDPFFSAGVGTGFRATNLGPTGLLFGASATLRRGLERLARTLTSWQGGTSIGLRDEEDLLVWTYRIEDPLIWPRRQDSEYTLAATIAIARDAFGACGRPLEVHVEHPAPEDPTGLARILGVQPRYGQPANRLLFDGANADRVHRREDRELIAILKRHVEDLRAPEGEEGLMGRVRGLIGLHLGTRQVSVPLIADELNVSARTLQRRLAEQGTSLRDLVRQRRLDLGRVYLNDGRMTHADIARALGYTDGTAFWRAFKAGTGFAPSHYHTRSE